MSPYAFGKTVSLPFDTAVQRITDELAQVGFGVLTEIDVQATMKKKLGQEMPPYRILGACNPALAFQALQREDKIGTMLPCNVVVQELEPGRSEVAAIDPVASMQAVENPDLGDVAQTVRAKLASMIERLKQA